MSAAFADVLLLVEIADSSVQYDREVKAPLYARHGIPEYWIINIPERRVEVHLDPDPEQFRYREIRFIAEGLLVPTGFPDVALDLTKLLG